MIARFRFLALIWSVFLSSIGVALAQGTKDSRPNVILITIDTLRADHLGCYGYKNIKTPNIDALAADGTRFENAYANVPTTLPSHSSILTGTYPMFHGMHDFSGNKLNPEQPTMASILKQQGFATGAVVAAAVLDSRFGLNSGFDFYYDNFDFNRLVETNLDSMERPGNVVADQALKWLGAHSQQRFMLWMHLYDPHYPYNPPPPFAEQYKDHPYDGEIAFADAQVGRLIQYLKLKNLYGKTLIVLSGDHGEGLGEHGEKTHGFFIYNSTLHVPLIFKMPFKSPADRTAAKMAKTVAEPVTLVDILPTVLASAKAVAPQQLQGHSLLPLIEAKTQPVASDIYSETYLPRIHFNWSELRGLHKDRYHFIEGPKPELYDLEQDPHELNNLYATKPALGQELRGSLATVIQRNSPSSEMAVKTSLDPALMERLKSLGYAAVSSGSSATLSDKNLPDPKDRVQVYETIAAAIEDSQHGRIDASIAKLSTVMDTEKDSVAVHYLLALNYYRKHDFSHAVNEFNRVLELSPDYALAEYYLGLAQVGTANWDAAISAFQRTLSMDKTNFSAAYNLGAAFLQKQMVPEAMGSFRQSVSINPDYAQGHRALGEMFLFQGNVEDALSSLQRAAELAPQDAKTHLDLSRAYEAKKMVAEAQRELQIAERLRAPESR